VGVGEFCRLGKRRNWRARCDLKGRHDQGSEGNWRWRWRLQIGAHRMPQPHSKRRAPEVQPGRLHNGNGNTENRRDKTLRGRGGNREIKKKSKNGRG